MQGMHAVLRAAAIVSVLGACGGDHAALTDAFVQPDANQPYFQVPVTYPAVDMVSVVAIGDVDGDGLPDLVVAGGHQVGSVAVLLGTGGGGFGDATVYAVGKLPSAIIAADLDGDGRADVALTDAGGDGVAFVARATVGGALGAWTSYPVGPWPLSMVAADVNADGHADLVIANNLGGSSNGVSVLLGNTTGGFVTQPGQAAGPYPMGVGVADFDRDGRVDLVIADQGPLHGDSTAAVMLGHGDGSFTAPTTFEVGNFPRSIAVGDLNGDGQPDIVVSNQLDHTTSVLIATGNGAFAPQQQYPVTGSSLAIADLDGDGKPEVLVAAGDVAVLHGVGDGTFDTTWSVPCGCGRIAIADVDRDGKPDLVGVDVVQNGATWDSPSNVVIVLLHAR
jgi:hypothetical protein